MSVFNRLGVWLAVLTVLATTAGMAAEAPAPDDAVSLEQGFVQPPDAARPWVYWFWLNGNITREGITADLEAMKRVGIGGVLIMEVDQGAPVGPVDFMSERWRELFQHVHAEARRLGLEINMNDDAGWNGSGGPWIKPEQSMQEVTWTETEVAGPQRFDGVLPQPQATAGFYRDIAVQAFPAVGDYRIPDIESKAAFQRRGDRKPAKGELTPQGIIAENAIRDLTAQMEADGRLVWDVPPGQWTVLRIGHTSTGAENAPAPASRPRPGVRQAQPGRDRGELRGHDGQAGRRHGHRHPPPGRRAGRHPHRQLGERFAELDREDARGVPQRRGYDLLPFLPVFTGRVVDSLEVSERFLWDLRRTVSELVIENYAGHFRRLANASGMRFTVEAYGGPCDCIPYGGQSDEPMGEFWTPGGGAMETCRGMASAGHVYGKRIIGAEAFTSGDQERWREHPALLKALGDRAFCEGINRFVFHRYAMQPWLDYRPGMTMGPWGQHYERTQTWWDQSRAWHEYLARCQFLLRQGLFVADICYLQAEAPPPGFGRHPRAGYDWDECTDDAVLTRMSVRDGRIVLPDGMSYRLLVLSDSRTMTPRAAAQAEGTGRGRRHGAGPAAAEIAEPERLSAVRRGSAAVGRRAVGRLRRTTRQGAWLRPRAGRVGPVAGEAAAEERRPARLHLPPAVAVPSPHHGDADIYFVANGQPFEATATCGFRVAGKVPELWWPESGGIERAGVYAAKDGVTRVALTLAPAARCSSSSASRAAPTIRSLRCAATASRCSRPRWSRRRRSSVRQARYGVLDDPQRTRDVTQKVQPADRGRQSVSRHRDGRGRRPAPSRS